MGEEHLPVIQRSIKLKDTLLNADINQAKTLILTTDDDKFNLSTALISKKDFGINNIVALVNNPDLRDKYKEHEIQTVTTNYTLVEKLASKSMFPDAEYHAAFMKNKINIVDVLIVNPVFENKKIKDIYLPEDTIIVYIIRDEKSIIPTVDTHIYTGDHLTLIGKYDNIQSSINLLSFKPDKK